MLGPRVPADDPFRVETGVVDKARYTRATDDEQAADITPPSLPQTTRVAAAPGLDRGRGHARTGSHAPVLRENA